MLTSRGHITEKYDLLPHKDLRNASSSLQGDAQLTLAYDMMITAANKNHKALQQPLTAAPRSQKQAQTPKVEYQASASLVSVQDARSQVPNCGSHVLSPWSQIPSPSITLLISIPGSRSKSQSLASSPRSKSQSQVLGVVFFWANATVRGMISNASMDWAQLEGPDKLKLLWRISRAADQFFLVFNIK